MSFTPRSSSDLELSLSVSLCPSSNGRHLVRYTEPEKPFFYLSDTAWEIFHRLNDEETEFYLRNRKSKGFNSVMIVVFAEHGGLDYPNREGEWPFFPASSSTPEKYIPDFRKPNPKYFGFVDRVVSMAAKLDITICFVPTWGRYVNGGYYGSPILFDDQEISYEFGYFLGQRYPFHPFILGGDSNRYWNPSTAETLRSGGSMDDLKVIDYGHISEAMAKGLKEGEKKAIESLKGELKKKADGYETFITFHSAQVWLPNTPPTSSSAQFPDADWITLDCIQTGHHDGKAPAGSVGVPTEEDEIASDVPEGTAQGGAVSQGLGIWKAKSSYIPIRLMYNTKTKKTGKYRPVIDLEAHYENTHYWFQENQPMWVGKDIRSGGWQAIFAGACGYTYGVNSIWQMHNSQSSTHPPIAPPTTASTNWFLELDLPGAFYSSIMRSVMLSLPNYFTRTPDNEFILSDRNEDGGGYVNESSGDDGIGKKGVGDVLIQGMKGDGWAMVHLPYGGEVTIDLEKAFSSSSSSKENNTYKAWWIDPKTGGREIFDQGEIKGTKEFSSPTKGSLDNDWLLYIENISTTSKWFINKEI